MKQFINTPDDELENGGQGSGITKIQRFEKPPMSVPRPNGSSSKKIDKIKAESPVKVTRMIAVGNDPPIVVNATTKEESAPEKFFPDDNVSIEVTGCSSIDELALDNLPVILSIFKASIPRYLASATVKSWNESDISNNMKGFVKGVVDRLAAGIKNVPETQNEEYELLILRQYFKKETLFLRAKLEQGLFDIVKKIVIAYRKEDSKVDTLPKIKFAPESVRPTLIGQSPDEKRSNMPEYFRVTHIPIQQKQIQTPVSAKSVPPAKPAEPTYEESYDLEEKGTRSNKILTLARRFALAAAIAVTATGLYEVEKSIQQLEQRSAVTPKKADNDSNGNKPVVIQNINPKQASKVVAQIEPQNTRVNTDKASVPALNIEVKQKIQSIKDSPTRTKMENILANHYNEFNGYSQNEIGQLLQPFYKVASPEQKLKLNQLAQDYNRGLYGAAIKRIKHADPKERERIMSDGAHPDHGLYMVMKARHGADPDKWYDKFNKEPYEQKFHSQIALYEEYEKAMRASGISNPFRAKQGDKLNTYDKANNKYLQVVEKAASIIFGDNIYQLEKAPEKNSAPALTPQPSVERSVNHGTTDVPVYWDEPDEPAITKPIKIEKPKADPIEAPAPKPEGKIIKKEEFNPFYGPTDEIDSAWG